MILRVDVLAPEEQSPRDWETVESGSQSAADDVTGVSVTILVQSLLVKESVILHVMVEPSDTDWVIEVFGDPAVTVTLDPLLCVW